LISARVYPSRDIELRTPYCLYIYLAACSILHSSSLLPFSIACIHRPWLLRRLRSRTSIEHTEHRQPDRVALGNTRLKVRQLHPIPHLEGRQPSRRALARCHEGGKTRVRGSRGPSARPQSDSFPAWILGHKAGGSADKEDRSHMVMAKSSPWQRWLVSLCSRSKDLLSQSFIRTSRKRALVALAVRAKSHGRASTIIGDRAANAVAPLFALIYLSPRRCFSSVTPLKTLANAPGMGSEEPHEEAASEAPPLSARCACAALL